MGWQPIETAPRDGSLIVCWAAGWTRPCFLCWKTNSRLPGVAYFGDPDESDDYELAEPGGGPTHWHPLAALPL